MQIQEVPLRAILAILALVVSAGSQTSAEPILRSNWVPNNGDIELEHPLGDLWTFTCPSGGTVNVSVDTKDDTDSFQSDINPRLLVVDGAGNLLASADEEVRCSRPPVCGAACPEVRGLACGSSGRHSIIVLDSPGIGEGDALCQEGGGYDLVVEVFAGDGSQLSERRLDLGGGPRRDVPRYARDAGLAPTGPALDDEGVPFGLAFR